MNSNANIAGNTTVVFDRTQTDFLNIISAEFWNCVHDKEMKEIFIIAYVRMTFSKQVFLPHFAVSSSSKHV